MPFPNLSVRDRRDELMDDPDLDEGVHRQALRGLQRINRISAIPSLLYRSIVRQCEWPASRPLRVLDVGCGGGDVSVGLWRRAQRAGRPIHIGGCDISPKAIRMSQERAAEAGAEASYFQIDVLNDPIPRDWDVVYCSLFLHHFDEAAGETLLANMGQAAGQLMLVNDLIRGRFAYTLCWLGVRLLTRSPIVHVDGPLSVRAGFRTDEVLAMAERAGLEGARITRHWPERLLLSWRRR